MGIACGGPADHVCDDKGPVLYTLSSGFTGTLFEACLHHEINPEMCQQDIFWALNNREIRVLGASVSCSKCERPAFADAHKMEI